MEARRKVLENEVVRDKNGIRRFHGAFTGGFSAGYWNTCGTEDGWAPGQFVSRRKSSTSAADRRPQDYMDEEDDPMLSNTLKTKKEYDTLGESEAAPAAGRVAPMDLRSPIPGPIPADFLIPSTNPIGKTLLGMMGWKEGQGVGPRLTASEKGYDESLAAGHTFAPENIRSHSIVVKNDLYGLGYTPSLRGLSQASKAQFLKMGDILKGGYSSTTGFGLGALEVDDDLDVYGNEDMNNYDIELRDPGAEEPELKPGRGKQRGGGKSSLAAVMASSPADGLVLEGFVKAKKKGHRPHRFKAPSAPPDYYPQHRFQTPLVVPNVRRRPLPVPEKSLAELERREALVPLSKVTLPEFKLKFMSEKDIIAQEKKKEAAPTLPERTVTPWRPENILCRRMNIPNPFQGAEGTPDNATLQDLLNITSGRSGEPVSMLDLLDAYDPNKQDPLLQTEDRPGVDLFKDIFG